MGSSICLPSISVVGMLWAGGTIAGIYAVWPDEHGFEYPALLARDSNHLTLRDLDPIDSQLLYPRGPVRKNRGSSTGNGKASSGAAPSPFSAGSQGRTQSLPTLTRQDSRSEIPPPSVGGLRRTDGWTTVFAPEPPARMPSRFRNELGVSGGKTSKVEASKRSRSPAQNAIPKSPWDTTGPDVPDRGKGPSAPQSPFQNAAGSHSPSTEDGMDWKTTGPAYRLGSKGSTDLVSKGRSGSVSERPPRAPALQSAGDSLSDQMNRMSTDG